jgi:hypothetical protein
MQTYKFSDLTDTQKQNIAEKWCRDMAQFTNENTIVEYVLQKSIEDSEAPFCHDDITNNQPYGLIVIKGCEHSLSEDDRDEKLEFYEYLRDKAENVRDNLDDSKIDSHYDRFDNWADNLQATCDDLENMDFEEHPEIYQWFSCDSYVLSKLEEIGECTLNGSYWGRTCCGQAIYLDYNIQQLAFDHFTDWGTDYMTQTTVDCNKFWGA